MPACHRLILATAVVGLLSCLAVAQDSQLKYKRVYQYKGKTTSKPQVPDWNAFNEKPRNFKYPDKKKITSTEQRAMLTKAIEQLKAEAKELDQIVEPKSPPFMFRPHPALYNLSGEMAGDVLDRMIRPFLGNEYRDTYIRWHLLHVIAKSRQSDRRQMGPKLIELIKKMPAPLAVTFKEEYIDVPQEVSAEWHKLYASTHVSVGYPPYQRDYRGEAALPFVTGDRKKQMEAAIKRMAQLKWERKSFPENIRFNQRVRKINWIVRQYRGELIYALLRTGDPQMARKVIREVGRQAKARQTVAFDLLAFMYLAAFDGVMDLYDQGTLRDISKQLEAVARGADFYYVYKIGDDAPPSYYHLRNRNFADYAFHLVYMLRDMDGISAAPPSGSQQQIEDEPEPPKGEPAAAATPQGDAS